MFKEDLLEPRERAEYRLIERLYYADGKINKRDLRQSLGLSLSTFNRYLADLAKILEPLIAAGKVQLMVGKDSITLALNGETTINDAVFMPFLEHSSFFKILLVLFHEHFQIAPRDFYRQLNLSEPSFYRKLIHLNELLQPFKLTIKNGCLIGPELQIRYFYLSLMRILPVDYFPLTPAAKIITQDVKKYLGVKLPLKVVTRVNHWWLVQEAANRSAATMNLKIPQALTELIDDTPLMKEVSQFLPHSLMIESPENQRFTIIDFCTFILIHADLILTTDQITNLIDYPLQPNSIIGRQQIALASSLENHPDLVNFPGSLLPRRKIFDIWLQPTIFAGVLYLYNDLTNDYLQKHLYTGHARLLTVTVLNTIRQQNGSYFSAPIQELIRRRLLQYFMEAETLALSPLPIGIDLLYTERINDFFERLLSRRLSNIANVQFKSYNTGSHYQLVVTNYPRKNYPNAKKVFRISEVGTITDINQIIAWVNQIQASELRSKIALNTEN